MLKDFYTLVDFVQSGQSIQASIRLNAQHEIFKGHFPQQPIVPGVCMLQIVKELLEHGLGFAVQITQGDNIKFLTMLNPYEVPEVEIEITHKGTDEISFYAVIQQKDILFFKCNAIAQRVT